MDQAGSGLAGSAEGGPEPYVLSGVGVALCGHVGLCGRVGGDKIERLKHVKLSESMSADETGNIHTET